MTEFDQSRMLYNEIRATNELKRGINWQGGPSPAAGTPPRTGRQFAGVVAFGAVTSQKAPLPANRSFPNFTAAAAALNWPRSVDGDKVQYVLRAQVGAGYFSRPVSFFFGSVITPPAEQADGITLAGPNYWRAEPYRTPVMATSDVLNWPAFASKLKAATEGGPDKVASFVKGKLSTDTLDNLDSYAGAGAVVPDELKTTLLDDLNRDLIGSSDSIYTETHFSGIVLSSETEQLRSLAALTAAEIAKLNRLLLDDAFPELAKFSRPPYYWSPHAQKVFATQPGPIQIVWRAAQEEDEPADKTGWVQEVSSWYRVVTKRYVVSGTTVPGKTPRTIYWTEGTYEQQTKPVEVPSGRVREVNFVLPRSFAPVTAAELSGSDYFKRQPTPPDLKIIRFDRQLIFAHAREGRLFVELLGDATSPRTREFLNYEIVDIKKHAIPSLQTAYLGDRLTAYPPEAKLSDLELRPDPIGQTELNGKIYRHAVASRVELYATKETTGDLTQVLWMEQGEEGIRWPLRLVNYRQVWPDAVKAYSHYIRPSSATTEELGKLTAVPLPAGSVPTIEYQDLDAAGTQRGKISPESKYYTWLDEAFPAHRGLLRYNAGENVEFERVLSWRNLNLVDEAEKAKLAGSVAGRLLLGSENATEWSAQTKAPRVFTQTAVVGQRLQSPGGEVNKTENWAYLAGHINKSRGTAYSVNAYKDPFAVGFAEAASGAIIPVNVKDRDNHGTLEVWWFRPNSLEVDKGFQKVFWPSAIGTYTLRWPTDAEAREIVLARNDGSGALSSLEAKGSIYYQNDPAEDGYNPNEEHALTLGGQVYALRDDLNTTDGNVSITPPTYSSKPYVLLEWLDENNRPQMTMFHVLRTNETHTFNYSVTAATILQPPMPLPLLGLPLGLNVIGEAQRSVNHQIDGWQIFSSTPSAVSGNSLTISSNDIVDVHLFWTKLKAPSASNPLDYYIGGPQGRLRPSTIAALGSYTGPASSLTILHTLKEALAADLNALVTNKTSLYEPARFASVTLRLETRELRDKSTPTEAEVRRLNRLLLEDAYPEALGRIADDWIELATVGTHTFKKEKLAFQQFNTEGLPETSHWFYTLRSSTPTNVIGFVSDGDPITLDAWNSNWEAQPAGVPNQWKYKIGTTNGLQFGAKAVLHSAASGSAAPAVNWLVTMVGGKKVTVGQVDHYYILLELPAAVTDPMKGATKLATSIASGFSANHFARILPTSPWRLNFNALAELSDDPAADVYGKATYQDRKGNLWVHRGPSASDEKFQMRFYYKTLEGFNFPTRTFANQPAPGTITPYLRSRHEQTGQPVGDAIGGLSTGNGQPVTDAFPISYYPVWPASAPILQMAETLTLPKRGLPAVRGQRSLRILYQQSQHLASSADRPEAISAILHDPTREKVFSLGEPGGAVLDRIPDSIRTSSLRGKLYFPNLPPHLVDRFFLDPNRGKQGSLVLTGEFVESPVGENFLLLNVLGAKDMTTLKALCIGTDPLSVKWGEMVDGLATDLERFVENPGRPGTFIPAEGETVRFGPGGIVKVSSDDDAVDSYALTAVGPETGYITLIAGNARNTDRQPSAEPVSMHVVKVVNTLYRGEVKVVQSDNPLNEKLTLQQVVDLAGEADQYNFEWMIASPVDGAPPPVYQNVKEVVLASGAWNHLPHLLSLENAGNLDGKAARMVTDVNARVTNITRLPVGNGVKLSNGNLEFTLHPSFPPNTLAPGVQLIIRTQNGTESVGIVESASPKLLLKPEQNKSLPAVTEIQMVYERALPEMPQSIVFRTLTLNATTAFSDFYIGLDLDNSLGAKVYVDGVLAVTANTGTEDTPTVSAPHGFFNASTPPTGGARRSIYRLSPASFGGGVESGDQKTYRIAVEFYSTAIAGAPQVFDLTIEAYRLNDLTGESDWLPLTGPSVADGVRAILGERADVRSLSDNYIIMRYQAKNSGHASWKGPENGPNTAWSTWTEPQLAEGWIKRVLAGINPFNQRITDLFNNRVNTDASILTQAGRRWEGDVALNLDEINNYGLIEIYETVLNRGKMLSIGSGINYGPANDALLLAAGYLNDLYLMLGNEAWADAANPTIGIGTKDHTYGDIATALFAFKGQLASSLEEELALLRGRDDSAQPGVEANPVYNRMFWNYTRGIDAGEVIYALNYNILDQNTDGAVNAADAAALFPQGHGDAYGHYLTALKGYYKLFLDTDFDWVPRVEAVTVLGKPVQVDYQDERKFAAAASALARAGRQTFDLTWRRDYKPGGDAGWDHLSTNKVNTRRFVPTTRYWGADHWASRTVGGAYLNWVVGNAILPENDNDPNHQGIQIVDRDTVPELKELPATAQELQTALDNAEGHLTPLGLPEGGLVFDINPNKITGANPETHFEQIYGRAKGALVNAVAAFDDAKDITRLMRSEQDSLADLQTTINQQEHAFNNALIELYGTPYPDDIGPGKTYKQGYTGPDLLHYTYVENPEKVALTSVSDPTIENTFQIDVQGFPDDWWSRMYTDFNFITPNDSVGYDNADEDKPHFIVFNVGPNGFYDKPKAWQSKRASPGKIQQAISALLLANNKLRQEGTDAVWEKDLMDKAIFAFTAQIDAERSSLDQQNQILDKEQAINEIQRKYDIASKWLDLANNVVTDLRQMMVDTIPDSNIYGVAMGGDQFKGIKAPGYKLLSVLRWAFIASDASIFTASQVDIGTKQQEIVNLTKALSALHLEQDKKAAVLELGDRVSSMLGRLVNMNNLARELDDAQRAYDALVAEGNRLQEEREIFRQRAAAIVQGFRTRDAAFRIFRNEKLERYKTLFDLSARYSFLAAQAYDYETGLLDTQQGREFVARIVNARALGVVRNNEPQYAGSNTGDPGLSSVLAEMKADWDVLKGRLGFNNPDGYGTTVSLRMEQQRIIPALDGDTAWQDVLHRARKANLLDDADVKRYCLQIDRANGVAVPGLVIEFSTTISEGVNLFGKPLAGGDHYFPQSAFATKIFAVGVAMEGYVGMDDPVANSSVISNSGGTSPPDPTFLGSYSLAATPGIYLIPVGLDAMRTPPLGDASESRTWAVSDLSIPLPFNIGGSEFSNRQLWRSSDSLTEPLFSIRKHQEFRPVSKTAAFSNAIYSGSGQLQPSQYTNNRLIGRSAWNTKWKLVIPGHKLLADPDEGLDRFIATVKDIKLHFVTYSYSGN